MTFGKPYYFVLLVMVMFLLMSCPESEAPTYTPTGVHLTIYDDQDSLLPGNVPLYLYDSESLYNEDKSLGEFSHGTLYVTNDSGVVDISGIDYDQDYYFVVTYRDRKRFVDLDNFDTDYLVSSEVIFENTESMFAVYLEQSKSAVTFYIEDFDDDQFPIILKLDGDSIGSLSVNASGVPTVPFEEGVTYKLSQSGQWTATSSLGCFWYGDVEIDGTASFTSIDLGACETGGVTFYSNDTVSANYPYRVYLDENDNLGTFDSPGTPQYCFDGSYGISVSRSPGDYSYRAVSANGQCILSGIATFTLDSCTFVELESCTEL